MTVSLYRGKVSHVGAVKYNHIAFRHDHPKYQGMDCLMIELDQKIEKLNLPQNTYILNLYLKR